MKTIPRVLTAVALTTLGPIAAALAAPQAAPSPKPKPRPSGVPTQPPFLSTKWTGDLDGMVKRRLIRALVVYSKTQYSIDKGVPSGAAYESLTAFETSINAKYKTANKNLKIHVVFIVTPRNDLIPALREGRGDIAAAGLTITPEREKVVDFSEPIFSGIDEIAVTGPQSPSLSTPDDLSGKEVFVRKSSSYFEHLQALNARFAREKKAPVTLRPAPEDLQDEDLLEMVNAGAVGIVVVDNYKAQLWGRIYKDLQPHPEIAVNTGGQIAWMIREGSPLLKKEIDAFAKTHRQGTLFGNTLIKKYTGSTRYIKPSTTPEQIAKFRRTVDLFRKYGDKYSMDYLLMAAQGFQESRLDQNAKSRVGAVGVMQVMPATGKDMKVGDITQIEPNINAGVKYMRFMIDQYFAKEPITPLNKGLFAFAAYNCGPGRMRQLRQRTAKRGLDPNVWFNNVEIVTAEVVGRETVTYVSNIYKYYIAYTLVSEDEERRKKVKEGLQKPS